MKFPTWPTPDRLKKQETNEVIDAVVFRGSRFGEQAITKEYLKEHDLEPISSVKFPNRKILVSKIYTAEYGADAVVGYVEENGKYIARTFLKSQSNGVWRCLPGYKFRETTRADGTRKIWNSKGHNEQSVILPFELQKELDVLSSSESNRATINNSDDLFFGLTTEMSEWWSGSDDFFKEVDKEPFLLSPDFASPDPMQKVSPEKLDFGSSLLAPDFSKPKSSWEYCTHLYGKVKLTTFVSKDGNLLYFFNEDLKGRVWIAGVESVNQQDITSMGVHKSWVFGGDLLTPAFEYQMSEKGYGNPKLTAKKYIDMYENYLSKIPVIQEYKKHIS